MIVCVDNHVLIWGVRGVHSPEQGEMVPRAKALLSDLEEKRSSIIVPAPVLTEYLIGVPPERQPEVAELIGTRFTVIPYDAAAAAIGARLWVERNGGMSLSPEVQAAADGASKQILKVDCQIVAIALAARANIIYSNDGGVRAFAGAELSVAPIPPITAQRKLDV